LHIDDIPIRLHPNFTSGLVQFGLPFPQGAVQSLQQLKCKLGEQTIESNAKVTAIWPDNSVKSCVLFLYIEQDLEIPKTIIVSVSESPNQVKDGSNAITESAEHICYKSEYVEFSYQFADQTFTFTDPKYQISHQGQITLKTAHTPNLTNSVVASKVLPLTALSGANFSGVEITIDGAYRNQDDQVVANYSLVFTFYASGRISKIGYTLHNPNRAEHTNGHWDLGDPNSLYIENLALHLEHTQTCPFSLSLEGQQFDSDSLTQEQTELSLLQHSSGGSNWQSPVHVNAQNQVRFEHRGYQVTSAEQLISSGLRAEPHVRLGNNLHVAPKQFWQRFPNQLSLSKKSLTLDWFPKLANQDHELQGGEKTSQTLYLGFGQDGQTPLNWVNNAENIGILPQDWLTKTFVNHFTDFTQPQSQWQALFDLGIDGDNDFFSKREKLDEYGWRNFGDIYADHETAEHKGDDLFVSHYNNQYDPILGFLKQYILSGENKWFELADDLAKHVTDIDIYHTQQDKAEYNGGLFWHTDHYVQAYTSSHRSYSKLQPSDVYQDHAGGGGPGGQHCYTSGLALHYALTGYEPSKHAVLTLTNWINHVYEGSGTCLELLLAFKNRHLAGFKNHFTGQYPLDRGTANYINALLDSYELTLDQQYLIKAEHVFTHTFHPNEDVSQRNLADVEGTWFYTVLLQSICKYLAIKQDIQQLDNTFYFCRDTLLNYARWMVMHENLYLDKPEILEYPNDTWTAQDLRKVQIFAAAHYYSASPHEIFLDKAKTFEHAIFDRLRHSNEQTYTRILVLMMQNYGYVGIYQNKASVEFKPQSYTWPAPKYVEHSNIKGLLSQGIKRLLSLSVKAELDWLKKRLN
jgi:hypothetical protein